jgi:cell division protein FtsW (lipid II flippase)
MGIWICKFGLGVDSFGMSLVTMLTVKGIYISLWMLLLIGVGVVVFCTGLGYYFEKKDIQNRITSHVNNNANPEVTKMCKDIVLIKKKLGISDE